MDDGNEVDRTLWCGNLSDEVTEELLYELFLQVNICDGCIIAQFNCLWVWLSETVCVTESDRVFPLSLLPGTVTMSVWTLIFFKIIHIVYLWL